MGSEPDRRTGTPPDDQDWVTDPVTVAGITAWAEGGPGNPHLVTIDAHGPLALRRDGLSAVIAHLTDLHRLLLRDTAAAR